MGWIKEELRYYVQRSRSEANPVEIWLGLAIWPRNGVLACSVELPIPIAEHPSAAFHRKLRWGLTVLALSTTKANQFDQAWFLSKNRAIDEQVLSGNFEVKFADGSVKLWPAISSGDLDRIAHHRHGCQFRSVISVASSLTTQAKASVPWA